MALEQVLVELDGGGAQLGLDRAQPEGRFVGTGRFELPTPCSQSRCATELRHVPSYPGSGRRGPAGFDPATLSSAGRDARRNS